MLRFGISDSIPQAPSPTTASTTTILNVALLKPCAKSSGLLTEKPLELCFNKGIRVFIKAELFLERLCLFDPLM